MRGVWTYLWAVTGVAVAAAGIGGRQAAADTLEWALVQAYQNNPSLNAQRAALRATDENVPQALSGYRPKLSVTANGGAEYQKSASQIPVAGALVNSTARADVLSAHHWRHRDVHALQRVADRQPHASGGEPGHGRTRNAARYRAAGAARCRHRLHEFAARRGDP